MTRTDDTRGNKIIDSRDIIARFNELDSDRDTNIETVAEHKARIVELEAKDEHTSEEDDELVRLQAAIWTAEDGTEYAESGDWDEEIETEWREHKALIDEADGYGDFRHGEALIRDDGFEDYARELAGDLGYLDDKKSNQWPYTCIDWEQAANELQQDYTSVEFGGTTYWIRS